MKEEGKHFVVEIFISSKEIKDINVYNWLQSSRTS